MVVAFAAVYAEKLGGALFNRVASRLVLLIGAYCLVSVTLNAYDVSVPGRTEPVLQKLEQGNGPG